MSYKKVSNASKSVPVPKSVTIEGRSHLTGECSLTIREDQVITKGSLTLGLQELKELIQEYEELE